jgi:hypothetical protein
MTRLLPPFVATVCDRLASSSPSLLQILASPNSCFIDFLFRFITRFASARPGNAPKPSAEAASQRRRLHHAASFAFAAQSGSVIAKQQPHGRSPRRGVAHLW